MQIVRSIEESILANGPANINIKTNSKIGFYTLNNKRSTIVEIENRNNILVNIEIDDSINEEIFILTRDVSKDSAIKKNASAISMNTVYEKPEIPESNKDIDSNKNLQITPENRSRSGNRRKNIRQKVSNDSIALDAKNSALTSSKNINEDKIVKSNSKDTEVDITKTKTTNTQRNYKSNVKKIENKVNENKIENVEKITKKIVQNKPKHIKPNQNKVKEEEPKNIKSIEKKVKKEEPKNIKSIEKKVEEEEPKIKKTGWWDS